MKEGLANCELKLLTTSKDVGLRRWRSFAAAFGGTGQIFNAVTDLLQHLNTGKQGANKPIVIYDQTLLLSALDLTRLQQRCRLFFLRPPLTDSGINLPVATAPAWAAEAYLQCSLAALLESPVVRASLMRLVVHGRAFRIESLLRWGYAMQTCEASGQALDRVSLAFNRSLNLNGEARRLSEMFTHFIQARVSQLGLRSELVTFGFDGILTLVAARCEVQGPLDIHAVAAELRVNDMHITMTNRLSGNYLEIAGLFHPQISSAGKNERMLLVLNRAHSTALQQPSASDDDASTEATDVTDTITHKAS